LTACRANIDLLTPNQVLAIGFLLVILSSALWHKYWPLLVVGIYVVAPLPNWICQRCANPDDFMDSSSNSAMDFGRFMTGFLVLTGIGTYLSAIAPQEGHVDFDQSDLDMVYYMHLYLLCYSLFGRFANCLQHFPSSSLTAVRSRYPQ
jgi:hypothetical protein